MTAAVPRREWLRALVGLAFVAARPWPVRAQGTLDGNSWLRRTIERATDLLTTPGTDEERTRAFGHLLADEAFDFEAIARFVLASHWNQASEVQREEFSRVLFDYLVAAYAHILKRLFAGTIDVFASRLEKNGIAQALGEELARAEKTLAQTDWSIVEENEAVLVFVRFKPRDGEAVRTMLRLIKHFPAFRIVDIWVNGVSLARTHRDDVAGVIRGQSGNLNAALAVIRRKTEMLRKG